MKKTIIVLALMAIVATFFLVSSPSSAHGRFYFGFGFFPPPVFVAPPPVYFPPPVYYGPPPVYYGPRYYPPPPDYRIWVPGYWDWRGTRHGWGRVWVPGHWEFR